MAGEALADLPCRQEGVSWWQPCHQVPVLLTYMWWHHSHVLQARFLQHLVHPDMVIGHILQSWGHLGWVPQKEGWGGGNTGHGEPKLEHRLPRPHSLPALGQDKTLQGLSTALHLAQPPGFLMATQGLTTSLPTCSCPVTYLPSSWSAYPTLPFTYSAPPWSHLRAFAPTDPSPHPPRSLPFLGRMKPRGKARRPWRHSQP